MRDPTAHDGDNERTFRDVIELLPAALYVCDAPSGQIAFYNAHAAKLWGREPRLGNADERFCGSFRLWSSDGSPLRPDETPTARAVTLGRSARNERLIVERPDGSRATVLVNVDLMLDATGRVVGAISVLHDARALDQVGEVERIDPDREATSRLYEIGKRCVRSGDNFIENLGEMLDTAVWFSRADKGNIQLYDDTSRALRLVVQRGFDAPFLEFFADVTCDEASACGAALASAERVVVEDVTTSEIFADQPSLKVLLDAGVRAVQSTPLVSSRGAVLGMVSTHFGRPLRPSARECQLLDVLARQIADYVERKRAEEQRDELLRLAERAREEAESANRAKDEFLAMLGHELRNPLSAVTNSVTAAMFDQVNRQRALEIAHRATKQLGRIVDDLLDVARITHGRVRLRKEQVSLAMVLERTVEGARVRMNERDHSLTLLLPAKEIRLEADAARIEQAVANLLTNAAKYTDPGGTVTVTVEQDCDDAVIRVRDNGIGIAPEVLPRVFDLFAQAERTLDRAQGGLGIGLTLVRRIVELHGGTVEAKSGGVGCGAEFVIRLPVVRSGFDAVVESRAEPRRWASPQYAARVLLVEDNPDAAESLAMLLRLLGHDVRIVRDGSAALEAARENLPDIMLVDIGLPGMDGYEVAKSIRRDVALQHLMLVALTGYGQPEDRARAMAAGFNLHLAKPVDLDALGDLVEHLRSRRKSKGSEIRH